jgi:hypothetical protein
MDQILDFATGDKVDLNAIDARSTPTGNDPFTFIGANAFGGGGAASEGELRAYQSSGTWYVEGDVNGDGTADLVLAVVADHSLTGADFVL